MSERVAKTVPTVDISDFRTPDRTPVSAHRLATSVRFPLLGRLNTPQYSWLGRAHSLALAPDDIPDKQIFYSTSVGILSSPFD